jgi:hypothetical protein
MLCILQEMIHSAGLDFTRKLDQRFIQCTRNDVMADGQSGRSASELSISLEFDKK